MAPGRRQRAGVAETVEKEHLHIVKVLSQEVDQQPGHAGSPAKIR